VPVNDLFRLRRMHHRIGTRRDKSVVRADFAEDFRMAVTMPFRFLNMFFRDDHTARPVETRAVDQAGLKRLQLLAGDNVIMNIDNHETILLNNWSLYLTDISAS